jgi:hypothetical protein
MRLAHTAGMNVPVFSAVGLGLVLASGALVSGAGGDSLPAIVTTDSPEYCQKLFDRISEVIHTTTAPPPVGVASLSREGQRMCNDGLTRGGILRLRRALLLLEQKAPTQ